MKNTKDEQCPAPTITKRPEQYFLISHWGETGGDDWAVYESLPEAKGAYRRLVDVGEYSVSILSNCIKSTDYDTVTER